MFKPNILSKTARCVWLVVMICSVSFVQAKGRGDRVQPVRQPFSNFAIGVNAGTVGFGASVATPLCNYVSLRGGFAVAPFSYSYTYDDFDFYEISGVPTSVADRLNDVELGLKAELQMTSGHLLFDIVPFRRGNSSFFISAGLYFGTGKLITVSGKFDDATMRELDKAGVDITDLSIEIGDVKAGMNPDGSVSADLKVRSVKPYVGLGFGRAIPRRRVGFRFELGALFHGTPEVVSDNISPNSKELSDVNKFLKDFKVYPQLNFQVTVRLLKDKTKK